MFIAPAESTTSRAARTSRDEPSGRRQATPAARPSSTTTDVARQSRTTSRFRRERAGRRYPAAALERRPRYEDNWRYATPSQRAPL